MLSRQLGSAHVKFGAVVDRPCLPVFGWMLVVILSRRLGDRLMGVVLVDIQSSADEGRTKAVKPHTDLRRAAFVRAEPTAVAER
jgi:hypothetical protein